MNYVDCLMCGKPRREGHICMNCGYCGVILILPRWDNLLPPMTIAQDATEEA